MRLTSDRSKYNLKFDAFSMDILCSSGFMSIELFIACNYYEWNTVKWKKKLVFTVIS